MIKTLQKLCIESFFTCKKTKLTSSYYCLLSYIHVLMNRREIYFLCENTSNDICLNYPKKLRTVDTVEDLKFTINYFKKLKLKKKTKTFKLIYFIDRIVDHVLKFKKYYILPELSDKCCDLFHSRSVESIKCLRIEESE